MPQNTAPTREVLTTLVTPDRATIHAVHDRAERSLHVQCTIHGAPLTVRLSPGITDADLARQRTQIVRAAARHANTRHPKPRVDSAGGMS